MEFTSHTFVNDPNHAPMPTWTAAPWMNNLTFVPDPDGFNNPAVHNPPSIPVWPGTLDHGFRYNGATIVDNSWYNSLAAIPQPTSRPALVDPWVPTNDLSSFQNYQAPRFIRSLISNDHPPVFFNPIETYHPDARQRSVLSHCNPPLAVGPMTRTTYDQTIDPPATSSHLLIYQHSTFSTRARPRKRVDNLPKLRQKRFTEDERKNMLERDIFIMKFTQTQVTCAGCVKHIKLDDRQNAKYYRSFWLKHRARCAGIKNGITASRRRESPFANLWRDKEGSIIRKVPRFVNASQYRIRCRD